jgi:hypothetical protein
MQDTQEVIRMIGLCGFWIVKPYKSTLEFRHTDITLLQSLKNNIGTGSLHNHHNHYRYKITSLVTQLQIISEISNTDLNLARTLFEELLTNRLDIETCELIGQYHTQIVETAENCGFIVEETLLER